ncbi:nucleotidyltransferase family protein [Iodidimonas sp. SYSU 1G8]|uniref:nucleotidyltransferase family protein n=1 Tax=Iodidimonas sp. SYSU 1G8 TaxID=3133967 RepID=UPI0031FEEF04
MSDLPRRAMVLCAGLGTRLLPLTSDRPKALVDVAGKPLVDWTLDALAQAGVEDAVVNHHYFGGMLVEHLAARTAPPRVTLSDESALLMDTGGGVVKALPLLGDEPFFIINADVVWTDGGQDTLHRMAATWDPARMDALLLVAPKERTVGFGGAGDFFLEPDGRLRRRKPAPEAPMIYASIQIASAAAFANVPEGPFSNNLIWDRALASGRLFGLEHEGWWLDAGTVDGRDKAEAFLKELCDS